MNPEYRICRSGMRTYMVLPAEEQRAYTDYRYRMLTSNHIEGLLKGDLRSVDGCSYLYYDITSRQVLSERLRPGEAGAYEIRELLFSVCRVMEQLEEYLLDGQSLLLSPEHIYYHLEKREYCFVYYPETRQEYIYRELFSFLICLCDSEQREEMLPLYQLCDLAEQKEFVLREPFLHRICTMSAGTDDMFSEEPEAEETVVSREVRRLPETEENESNAEGAGKRKKFEMQKGIFFLAGFFSALGTAAIVSRPYYREAPEMAAGMGAAAVISAAAAILLALIGLRMSYCRDRKDRQKEKEEKERLQREKMVKTMEAE